MCNKKRVALVLAHDIDECVDRALIDYMERWCEAEGYNIVVLTMAENEGAIVGNQTLSLVKTLIDEDMIDGIVTYTVFMLNSAEGEAIVDYVYSNDKFFVPYAEEMKERNRHDMEYIMAKWGN